MVSISEDEVVEIEAESEVGDARVGDGAFGQIAVDVLVAELLGRLDFDGHAAIVHVRA
jgi:hypothetical protein